MLKLLIESKVKYWIQSNFHPLIFFFLQNNRWYTIFFHFPYFVSHALIQVSRICITYNIDRVPATILPRGISQSSLPLPWHSSIKWLDGIHAWMGCPLTFRSTIPETLPIARDGTKNYIWIYISPPPASTFLSDTRSQPLEQPHKNTSAVCLLFIKSSCQNNLWTCCIHPPLWRKNWWYMRMEIIISG